MSGFPPRGGSAGAPLRLVVEPLQVRCPDQGVASAVAPLLAPLAPARSLRVLELAWGRSPGLQAAPWTRAGVQAAASRAGLTTTHETLELWRGADALDHEHTLVTAQLPGTRRARNIPQAWFGEHACVVLPLASLDRERPRARGPLEAAASALDLVTGAPRQREDARVAVSMLGTVFASLTVVLDGSWWAELGADADAARALTPLERCIAASSPRPSPPWGEGLLDAFDRWFALQLRLPPGRRRGTPPSIRTTGTGATLSWPRVAAAPPTAKRRTRDRVVEALWRPSSAPRNGLGPTIPGPLARVWKGWSP